VRSTAKTYQAVDEGRHEALSIAVASAVVGTAGVVLALGTGRVHLGQVQSAVHAAGQLGGVDIEGELEAGQVEHLIAALRLVEQVDTRRRDAAVGQNVLQAEAGAVGGDAVLAVVGDTLHDAVLGARLDVRADILGRRVAPVAAVAPAQALGTMDGVRQRVEHDVVGRRLATTLLRAAEGRELGVNLLGLTRLLAVDQPQEERGQAEESGTASHGCLSWCELFRTLQVRRNSKTERRRRRRRRRTTRARRRSLNSQRGEDSPPYLCLSSYRAFSSLRQCQPAPNLRLHCPGPHGDPSSIPTVHALRVRSESGSSGKVELLIAIGTPT
jgi:hypothetical protein